MERHEFDSGLLRPRSHPPRRLLGHGLPAPPGRGRPRRRTGTSPSPTPSLGGIYEQFGENWLLMQPAKPGLPGLRRLGASPPSTPPAGSQPRSWSAMLQPFAPARSSRSTGPPGTKLVLATTSPEPFVRPLAEALGFDDVVCDPLGPGRRHLHRRDRRTLRVGSRPRPMRWPPGPRPTASPWPAATPTATPTSTPPCSTRSATRSPSTPTPSWPPPPPSRAGPSATSTSGRGRGQDRRPGDPGVDPPPHAARARWPPASDITFEGSSTSRPTVPALVVFNHRSYFDPTVMGLLVGQGRPQRPRPRQEGGLRRPDRRPLHPKALGGIRVERASGSDEPLKPRGQGPRRWRAGHDGPPGHDPPRARPSSIPS